MTATERLRELLTERGVEYEKADGWWTSWETEGATSIGGVVYCEDLGEGLEIRWHIITPEQAIAATLGHSLNNPSMSETLSEQGTCHIIKRLSDSDFIDDWKYLCSECGCFIPVNERDEDTGDVISAANYCPNCGRRCVV